MPQLSKYRLPLPCALRLSPAPPSVRGSQRMGPLTPRARAHLGEREGEGEGEGERERERERERWRERWRERERGKKEKNRARCLEKMIKNKCLRVLHIFCLTHLLHFEESSFPFFFRTLKASL